MKTAGETITEMVNAGVIEEVGEACVTQASNIVSDQMLVSMAISAKRQADAVERIAFVLTGDNQNSGLIYMLDQIALGAQRR